MIHFTFDGIRGRMDHHGMVAWGGMAFQREAAIGMLRELLDKLAGK